MPAAPYPQPFACSTKPMPQSSLFNDNLHRFFASLGTGDSVLLTPNKRLSRFLTQSYGAYRLHANGGVVAGQYLQCMAIGGWLQQLWQQLQLKNRTDRGEQLLQPDQEILIWEEIIEGHPLTPSLLNTGATARMAQEAWRLAQEWQLPLSAGDNRVLFEWCQAFQAHCRERQLLTIAELPARLQAEINDGSISVVSQLVLYGFDELSPAVDSLLNALTSVGVSTETLKLEVAGGHCIRHEFADDELELNAAAHWALQQFQQNAQCQVAVVVPNLSARRTAVERIFTQVLDASYLYPEQPQHAPGYNISAGQPLARLPMIAIGLQCLQWSLGGLELNAVSKLLRSPFIGSVAELGTRAGVDLMLRELGELKVDLQVLKTLVAESIGDQGQHLCEDFHQRLQNFDREIKQQKNCVKFPSEWAPALIAILNTLGWPGQRRLDSLEYQQLQSWQENLEAFSRLDHALGRISLARAVSVFGKLLQQRSFQAQTQTSPIQILGVLEAAGLPFDAIWVAGLDDENWPAAPNPNALLPLPLQIQYQLPQCSAERELEYARRLQLRLQMSTRSLVLSNALAREDKQLRASPLAIDACSEISEWRNEDHAFTKLQLQLFGSRDIESVVDEQGPAVTDPAAIRGGTQILKSQAACPFQAFARYRLGSEAIPEVGVGLSPAERGNLVHAILEVVWRRLKSQQQLLAMNDTQVDELVAWAVDVAVQDIRSKRIAGERFLQLETARLSEQTRDWLALEKLRKPFEVLSNERSTRVQLANMPIHIRYDRIDRLEDGSLFVLDYKTGKPDIADWCGDRPHEPQVPLYAIANSDTISGAAFGLISADTIAFRGIAEDGDLAPELKTPDAVRREDLPASWPEILTFWRTTLENLAEGFIAGDARVDPKLGPVTCRHCDLQTLCRIRDKVEQTGESHPVPGESVAAEGENRE